MNLILEKVPWNTFQSPSVRKSLTIMRNVILFLLFGTLQTFASISYSQSTKITLTKENSTVQEVLSAIEQESEFIFTYNVNQINANRRVSVDFRDESITNILDKLFAKEHVRYAIDDRHIVLYKENASRSNGVQQAGRKITCIVTDASGPVIGANVMVKGTTIGTMTDTEGKAILENIPAKAELVVSFVGYLTQEISVKNQTSIQIVLKEDTKTLDEVVIVAYGTQKKRDVIGSMATLNSSDVMKLAPTSIESTLQGMASGVQVNTGDGVPGAPQQIKIRGIGSISSGTDPLWIIDGIPVQSHVIDNRIDGETNQSVLSMFNPNDIESIQVLKDAGATSIYGSRGSNGVILVTTKSGKKGALKVSADYKTGISNWAKSDIGYANNTEYISIMDKALTNVGSGKYEVTNTIRNLDGATETMTQAEALQTNTNWADVMSRTGNFYEANLSASQGTEKGNSYTSLKWREDHGNLKFNNMKTMSANTNANYHIMNVFDLGYRLFASYTDNDRLKSGDGKAGAGGWAQVNSNALPWMKIYDPAGFNGYWNSRASVNPLASIDPVNAQSNLKTLNVLSSLTGTLHLPIKGLSIKGEYGLNYVADRARSWRSSALLINGAEAQEQKYETIVSNYNAFINYDVPINNANQLNLVAGIENTRQYTHVMNLKGNGLVGIYPEVGTPTTLSGNTGITDESYLRGYFARANYKLLDKYLVGASVRRDGISKFTSDNRWATFISGSLGWIISEEKFFKFEPISLLKLRGSYGQTGNINTPSNITSDSWGQSTGVNTLVGENSTTLNSIGNSDTKWETTTSVDVGIDYGLFKNRINGSIAYYRKKVSDMLLAVSLPPSAGIHGGNRCWENIGDMRNEGFEFDINSTILNEKDWTVTAGFNISTNSNKVLSLDPQSDANGTGLLLTGSATYGYGILRTITKKGLAYGTWYMAESAGVDAQKGIPMIYEVKTNEDGTTEHTGKIIPATNENMTNNRMILKGKTSMPKVLGGFNAYVKYKNFDMSMVWSFVTGNYIYNHLLQSSMTPNIGMLVLNTKLLTDSWEKSGDNAKYPQVTAGNLYFYDNDGNATQSGISYGSDNNTPTSQYLEKGDYLKLRNLTIGYNLPAAWVQRCHLGNVRIYISGNNLLTLTGFSGYDPELSIDQTTGSSVSSFYVMPSSRTLMAGINVNF